MTLCSQNDLSTHNTTNNKIKVPLYGRLMCKNDGKEKESEIGNKRINICQVLGCISGHQSKLTFKFPVA